MLRGRETVRADRRLRTDEKRIRAQSAILNKSHTKPPLLLTITVFSVPMCFSSVQKTGLARASAQVLQKPARPKIRPRGSLIAHG